MAVKKVFWTGGAGDGTWTNKGNWWLGDSPTDPNGSIPTYYPGSIDFRNIVGEGDYPSIYITRSATIKIIAAISRAATVLGYIGDLYIQGTSSSPISVTISDSEVSGYANLKMTIHGDFVVKDCSYFAFIVYKQNEFGSIILNGKSTGSVLDIGSALESTKFILSIQFGQLAPAGTTANWTGTLASDLIMSGESGIYYYQGTINLNGYGLTTGMWYNRSGLNPPPDSKEIIFTPRPDNWTTGQNNLSYLRISGVDLSKIASSITAATIFTIYTNNSVFFKGIGQRAIIVFGIDAKLKERPLPLDAPKLISVEIGYYWTEVDHSLLLAYDDKQQFSPDLYFIDEHPENMGVYFAYDRVYGTVDFTGSTPGDNVPTGPGFKSSVGFHADATDLYFFTGNFLLNSDQKIVHLSTEVKTGPNLDLLNISYLMVNPAPGVPNQGRPIMMNFIHQPKIRRNTIQGWNDDPTPLANGEIGWGFDPNNPNTAERIKIGNGGKSWKNIPNDSIKNQAAGWSSTNPILKSGQIGWETNTNKLKIGDGVTRWNLLNYASFNALPTYVDYPDHPSYYCGLGDGWALDFKKNSLRPTKNNFRSEYPGFDGISGISDGTMFFLKPNAKVYLLSDLSTNNVRILCPDTTGCIFLVGTARIVFAHVMFQDGGTVSTVYSDGDSTYPKIINTHNPVTIDPVTGENTSTWINAMPRPPLYDYRKYSDMFSPTANSLAYYVRGYWLNAGLLDLYSERDIELKGRKPPDGNPNQHDEYNSSVFIISRIEYAGNNIQTDRTSNINFYFFSPRTYSNGIISTDLFLQKTSVIIGMYSDIGNLVSTSSDENFANYGTDFVAIKTVFGGNNAATSSSPLIARSNSSELGTYRSAVVWYETTDIYLISTTAY